MQMLKGRDGQSGKVFFFAYIGEANDAACLPRRSRKAFTKSEVSGTRHSFKVLERIWCRAVESCAFQDHTQLVDDPKSSNIPLQSCYQQTQHSVSGRTLIRRFGKQTSHRMTYVPVVLRAQSIYLLLIGHGAIVLDQFLTAIRKDKAWGIRPVEVAAPDSGNRAYFRVRSNFSASLE